MVAYCLVLRLEARVDPILLGAGPHCSPYSTAHGLHQLSNVVEMIQAGNWSGLKKLK